jgi:hypothetical protein
MENTQSLNVTQYLDTEDINMISKINQIKRDITAYFDMDLFIDNMRKIIDESKHFDFRSKTSRNFIEKDKPTFIVKYISDEVVNELNSFKGLPEEVEDKQVDYIADLISIDIISKFSRFITDCITDSEKLNDLFSELPKDVKEFFISNIYTIRVNVKENNIYIIYFI